MRTIVITYTDEATAHPKTADIDFARRLGSLRLKYPGWKIEGMVRRTETNPSGSRGGKKPIELGVDDMLRGKEVVAAPVLSSCNHHSSTGEILTVVEGDHHCPREPHIVSDQNQKICDKGAHIAVSANENDDDGTFGALQRPPSSPSPPGTTTSPQMMHDERRRAQKNALQPHGGPRSMRDRAPLSTTLRHPGFHAVDLHSPTPLAAFAVAHKPTAVAPPLAFPKRRFLQSEQPPRRNGRVALPQNAHTGAGAPVSPCSSRSSSAQSSSCPSNVSEAASEGNEIGYPPNVVSIGMPVRLTARTPYVDRLGVVVTVKSSDRFLVQLLAPRLGSPPRRPTVHPLGSIRSTTGCSVEVTEDADVRNVHAPSCPPLAEEAATGAEPRWWCGRDDVVVEAKYRGIE